MNVHIYAWRISALMRFLIVLTTMTTMETRVQAPIRMRYTRVVCIIIYGHSEKKFTEFFGYRDDKPISERNSSKNSNYLISCEKKEIRKKIVAIFDIQYETSCFGY